MMLAIDLFAGLFGWGEGLIRAGYETIGFDIINWFAEFKIERRSEFNLVLQDVRTLHGKQFKEASLIVASPPCQEYSYRAMPWRRARSLPPPSNELFDTCFRIQREASEAAGRYVPMVVENVRGAQKWVGRAKWHYGSYYLWGDVPALMPYTLRVPKFIMDDIKNGQRGNVAGIYQDGIKSNGNGAWFGDYEKRKFKGLVAKLSTTSSRSNARKQASMEVSRIPYPLSFYIGQYYVRSSCNWTAVGECGETLRSEVAPLLSR